MGKTLYLNENNNDLLVKRDGPSVWITGKERAGQRVPARVLSRVVIIGNVRLDAGAVTLFTENNIPVLFMTRSAEEVAMAIPYNHTLPAHYEEQKVFLASKEHIERYEKWANTKRMIIQINIMKRLYRSLSKEFNRGIGEGNYRKLISNIKPVNDEKWLVVKRIVNHLLRGMVIEHLLKANLDLHTGIICRRHSFGLALDICYIMDAESDMQSLQFFRKSDLPARCLSAMPAAQGGTQASNKSYMEIKNNRWVVTDLGMKNIIHRFENRKNALSNMVENIIDELFELMRELRT